jgi:hypothetical protein
MKPEIAKKWVEALRSGKYAQYQSALRGRADNRDRFCCLGVLCDIVKDDINGRWVAGDIEDGDDPHQHMQAFAVDKQSDTDALPDDIRRFAGMESALGSFYTPAGSLITLARLNDWGRSFETIADVIENNVRKL